MLISIMAVLVKTLVWSGIDKYCNVLYKCLTYIYIKNNLILVYL